MEDFSRLIIKVENITLGDVIEETRDYSYQRGSYFGEAVLVRIQKSEMSAERFANFKKYCAMRSKIGFEQNISKFVGVLVKPNYGIVTEYMAGGTLEKLIEGTTLNAEKAIKYGLQIIHAIHYLHESGIVHRKLKPSNIYLAHDQHTVKLGEFVLQGEYTRPGIWTAPETLIPTVLDEIQSERPWKCSCDVYSFGYILWKLLIPNIPFKDMDGLLHNSDLDESMQTLLMECCSDDPNSRPESKSISDFLERYSKKQ